MTLPSAFTLLRLGVQILDARRFFTVLRLFRLGRTMQPEWSILTKRYRVQFGLTQHGMGQLLGVSQKTVSRWESGENEPSLAQQQQLRELLRKPGNAVSAVLRAAVAHCPAKRILALHKNCTLLAASKPSIALVPSIVDWIGRSLSPIASGVLLEIFDDRQLQRGIAAGEIAGISFVSRNVLTIGKYPAPVTLRSTTSYFFIDGTLFSDTISVCAGDNETPGYRPIALDEIAGG